MADLQQLRDMIDQLDAKLVSILADRLKVCADVAALKAREGIPMMQPGRVAAVTQRSAQLGVAHGLRAEFLERLYGVIIAESCALEDDIIAQLTEGRM